MHTPRSVELLGALLISAAVVVGCGSASPSPSASQPPAASPSAAPTDPVASPSPTTAAAGGPILMVETQGGECMQGACGGTIAFEADGRIHTTAPTPAELGTLSEVTRDALMTEIAAADFGAIRSHAFTGTCPIAFDGQEITYTFATTNGPIRIDSCEVAIDPAHPLFVAATAAVEAAAAQP